VAGDALAPWAPAALALLSTFASYCLHGLLWAALAAIMVRASRAQPTTQRALFGLSLLAPLLTTALAGAWPHELSLGAWSPMRQVSGSYRALELGAPATGVLEPPALFAWSLRIGGQAELLAACLVGLAALGVVRFAASLLRLRRALHGRSRVRDARLNERFARLQARAGVRGALLSESVHVTVPLVVGRREVCVPAGFSRAFCAGEVDAILAHELAHLARGDGLWFPAIALLETLLWMQPLNRLLAARFRRSAELAADDRAVELTHAPLLLARALTRMAEAALGARGPRLLPAMASRPSVGLERVQRLLQATHGSVASGSWRAPGWWPVVCMLALGLATLTLRAEVAAATPEEPRTASAPITSAAPVAQPDLRAHGEEMDALAQRAYELERSLAEAHAHPTAAPDALVLLELEQALRHTRATQAWSERRFEAAWAAWHGRDDRRSAPPPR